MDSAEASRALIGRSLSLLDGEKIVESLWHSHFAGRLTCGFINRKRRGWRTFRSGVGCGCGAWALAGDLFTTCSDCSACTKQGPCERTGIDSEREGDGGHFGRKCAKDCGGRAFGERPGSPKAAETHKTKYGSGSLPTYSSSGMFVDELDSTESSEPLCRYV